MSEKSVTATTDVSTITLDKASEFVTQPYNYQTITNVSSSSTPIDMRNMKIEKEEGGLEITVNNSVISG